MIDKAKKNTGKFTQVHLFKGNAENIPLEDKSVDYLICTNSFHHYKDDLTVLKEELRILKPNGRIVRKRNRTKSL